MVNHPMTCDIPTEENQQEDLMVAKFLSNLDVFVLALDILGMIVFHVIL